MGALYDDDTYTWAIQQADALRRRSVNEIDWDNVAEEIESVGKSEAKELISRFTVLLVHLLKLRFQPGRRGTSWQRTIVEQRSAIADHLVDNPGLKRVRDELFGRAYRDALRAAARETGLPIDAFPQTNPFTLTQAVDEDFWPAA